MGLLYNAENETIMPRSSLHALPLPTARGRFHKPVPFGEFADLVGDSLESNGFAIKKEEYAVAKDNNRFFGLMEIALEGEYLPAERNSWLVGLRGSHDQRIPRGITIGSRVIVCSNLCFHGDLGVISTKQTTRIMDRLPRMVDDAISVLPARLRRKQDEFDRLQKIEITPNQGDSLLVGIYRAKGFNPHQLSVAIDEWHEPSYNEHKADGWTAWRLLQASTEALKPSGNRVNHDLIRQRSQVIDTVFERLSLAA